MDLLPESGEQLRRIAGSASFIRLQLGYGGGTLNPWQLLVSRYSFTLFSMTI